MMMTRRIMWASRLLRIVRTRQSRLQHLEHHLQPQVHQMPAPPVKKKRMVKRKKKVEVGAE